VIIGLSIVGNIQNPSEYIVGNHEKKIFFKKYGKKKIFMLYLNKIIAKLKGNVDYGYKNENSPLSRKW